MFDLGYVHQKMLGTATVRFSRIILLFSLALALGACSSKFKRYNGPEVTRVVVEKSVRKMYLLNNDKVLRTYDIGPGFEPIGHKFAEGDGRTPEGRYTIDRRNPNSKFHLSISIDYPNEVDVEVARKAGNSPGGDIFIHGGPRPQDRKIRDWTAGCIAVRDKDIEWIYAMVEDGTPIDIYP